MLIPADLVIGSRKKPRGQRSTAESAEPGSASLFEEGKARGTPAKGKSKPTNPNKLTPAQLRDLEVQKEREAAQQWKRVQELWPRMLAGEEEPLREWLIEAEKLVEAFRETRALFLTSRVRHVGSLRSIKVADGLSQHRGFRGMFPRSSRKQPSEANEDNMASRLQLELGMFIFKRTSPL